MTMPNPPENHYIESRYTVNSSLEILLLLLSIKQHKLLVNLSIPGSGTFIITSILAVNENSRTVIFDCAQNETLNRRFSQIDSADFSVNLDGVYINFATGKIDLCDFESRPALKIELPRSVVRLQRREYFRITMPIVHPVYCLIRPPADAEDKPVITNVMDLGCGGISLSETSGRLDAEIGMVFPDCEIQLPETEIIATTLEVRNSAQTRLRNGTTKTRFGCRFVDLPKPMAKLLQQYITQYEREWRNRL